MCADGRRPDVQDSLLSASVGTGFAKQHSASKSRISEVDSSVPVLDETYAYYSRYVVGNDHPVYYRFDRNNDSRFDRKRGTGPMSYHVT